MANPSINPVSTNLVQTPLQAAINPTLLAQIGWSQQMVQNMFNQLPGMQQNFQNIQAQDQANYNNYIANQQTPQQIAPEVFNPPAPSTKAQGIKQFYQSYIDQMKGAKTKEEIKKIQGSFKPNFDMSGLSPTEAAEIKAMQGSVNSAASQAVSNLGKSGASQAPTAKSSTTTALNSPTGTNNMDAIQNALRKASANVGNTGRSNQAQSAYGSRDVSLVPELANTVGPTGSSMKEAGTLSYNPAGTRSAVRAPGYNAGGTSTESVNQFNAMPATDPNATTPTTTTGNGNYPSDQRPNMPGYTWGWYTDPATGEQYTGYPKPGAIPHNMPTDEGLTASGYTQQPDGTWINHTGTTTFNPTTGNYGSGTGQGAAAGTPNGTAGATAGTGTAGGTTTGGAGTTTGQTGGSTVTNAGNTGVGSTIPSSANTVLGWQNPVTPFDYAGQTQLAKPGEETDLMNINKQLLKTNPAVDAISNSMTTAANAMKGMKDYSADAFKAGGPTDAELATQKYLAGQMDLKEDPRTLAQITALEGLQNQTEDEKYLSQLLRERSQMGANGDYRTALYEASADPLRREAARMQEQQAADLAARGLGASTIVNDINSATQRDLMANLGDLSNRATVDAEKMRQDIINQSINQMQTGGRDLGARRLDALKSAGTLRQADLSRISDAGLQAAQQQGSLQNAMGLRGIEAAKTAGGLSGDYAKTQATGAQLQAGLATAKAGLNQQTMDNIQDLVDKQQARELTNINLGMSNWDKRNQNLWNLINLPQNIYAGQNPLMNATANLTGQKYQADLASAAAKNQAKANLFGTLAGSLLSGGLFK